MLGTVWAWLVPHHFLWALEKIPGTPFSLTALGLRVIMLGMGLTLADSTTSGAPSRSLSS